MKPALVFLLLVLWKFPLVWAADFEESHSGDGKITALEDGSTIQVLEHGNGIFVLRLPNGITIGSNSTKKEALVFFSMENFVSFIDDGKFFTFNYDDMIVINGEGKRSIMVGSFEIIGKGVDSVVCQKGGKRIHFINAKGEAWGLIKADEEKFFFDDHRGNIIPLRKGDGQYYIVPEKGDLLPFQLNPEEFFK